VQRFFEAMLVYVTAATSSGCGPAGVAETVWIPTVPREVLDGGALMFEGIPASFEIVEGLILVYDAGCDRRAPDAACEGLGAVAIGHIEVGDSERSVSTTGEYTGLEVEDRCEECVEGCRCACSSLPWYARDSFVVLEKDAADFARVHDETGAEVQRRLVAFCDTATGRYFEGLSN